MRFLKTSIIAASVAILMMGCQKDNGAEDVSQPEQNVTLKYAEEVKDYRDWGVSGNWMGEDGALSFLKEGINLPDRYEGILKNVPSGIKVTSDSYVYLTFVGEVAAYNNVLGYYYYNENQLSGNLEEDREFILSQIFNSDKKGVNMNQVVFSSTRGMGFCTTIKLSTDDKKEFPAETIIGFYLLPNRGGDDLSLIEWTADNKPYFIATDRIVNTTAENTSDEGVVSHIMGQTECGDMVIAFEDLNSLYSKSSDEDYNDLVFVVSDNLNVRQVQNIEPYKSGLDVISLKVLGDNCPMHKEKLTAISWNNSPGINNMNIIGIGELTKGDNYLSENDFKDAILGDPGTKPNAIFTYKALGDGKFEHITVAIYSDGSWKGYAALEVNLGGNGGNKTGLAIDFYRIF